MQRYNEYGSWLTAQLGVKAQKISLNAGFTCPNRDGRVGTGGCTYCNNQTFNPDYCAPTKSITQQLEEGKAFFARKYPDMKYLAYFQAYTNTYDSLENLKAKYEEALRVPGVVGLVIGTRPDCMPDSLLDYLDELHRRSFLLVEYGVESIYDKTLLRIHRGHTHAQTVDAIRRTECRPVRGLVLSVEDVDGVRVVGHDGADLERARARLREGCAIPYSADDAEASSVAAYQGHTDGC